MKQEYHRLNAFLSQIILEFIILLGQSSQMIADIDEIDRRILSELQKDAMLSVDALSARIHLSRNACWRRVKRMEDEGIIKGRVALINPDKLGLGLTVFMLIRTSNHDPQWLAQFRAAVSSLSEVVGVHRMSGDLDYIVRARIEDMKAYDRLYQRLIARVPLSDVSASFVMEDIKDTTEIPLFG
jgi:Lrp/AsnC family transcriptional regulator